MKRRLGVRDGMRGFFSRFMLFVFRFQRIHETLEIVLLLGLGEGVIVEYRLRRGIFVWANGGSLPPLRSLRSASVGAA